MNGSIEVEKHMLAKEKSAVPLGLTEPFAAVEWKIIEVGILIVLINASEGKAILHQLPMLIGAVSIKPTWFTWSKLTCLYSISFFLSLW